MATLRSRVSAWPASSKAMTTTAAPYRRARRACRTKGSSPSFRLMELTIPLPWRHFSPASSTDQREESIITGTRAIAGSDAIWWRNRTIASRPSSIPSSMFTSMTWAPFSTCWRATSTAPSKSPASTRRLKAAEPVTLVRSPTLTKSDSGPTLSASRPASRHRFGTCGIGRGG